MAGSCKVFLLGGFRVDVNGDTVNPDRWRSRRAADLVKLLALNTSHQLHRDLVVDALWPELTTDAGSANLRKAIHFARRSLGTEEAIRVEAGVVRLWPDGDLSVDVEEFEGAAADALRTKKPERAARVLETYSPELLPEDAYASWTEESREGVRKLQSDLLRAAGRWEKLVDLDPLDEDAHRSLMRNYWEAGRRQDAMRQFEKLRRALIDELGVAPQRDTIALYEEILAEEGTEPTTPAERARAHIAAALVALNRMETREAEREAMLARAIASEEGLGRELGEASGALGMAAHARGGWKERFRIEFEDTVRDVPHLAEFVFDAHLCLAEFAIHGSETADEIERFARELLPIADASGSKHGRAVASLMLGEAEFFSGQLDAAEMNLELASDSFSEVGATSGHALALQRLAQVSVERHQKQRTNRLLREAEALAAKSPLTSHLLIRVQGTSLQAAMDSGDALSVIRAIQSELGNEEICDPCSVDYRVNGTIALARAGELEEAKRWLDAVERVTGMWQAGWSAAIVWQARAEVRLAENQESQAAALFLEAAERFGRAGYRLYETKSREQADSLTSSHLN
jgi:DNA-binding SARP family transcriptional activator